MEITRGKNLGPLGEKLGIQPDAKVRVALTADGGAQVWDLSTETLHTVKWVEGTVPTSAASAEAQKVPPAVKEILNAPDAALLSRLRDSRQEGATDERETMFSELVARGVKPMG